MERRFREFGKCLRLPAACLAILLTACMLFGCAGAKKDAGTFAPVIVVQTEGVQTDTEPSAMYGEAKTEAAQKETKSAATQTESDAAQKETADARQKEAEPDAVQEKTKTDVTQEETEAATKQPGAESSAESEAGALTVLEDGVYTSRDEVALYLHLYGRLPSNFITKKEAEALGWKQKQGKAGELSIVAPGKSIGGSRFGNYEEKLPKKKGRTYYECDIDYESGNRNAKRLVYSDDGLIFYTEDHYETFEQLYPME